MTDNDRPLYQVTGGRRCGYEVLRRDGSLDPEMTYYGEPCERIELVAATTSKAAALAVLRLLEVTWFADWTQKDAHWGMPMTELQTSEGRGEKR